MTIRRATLWTTAAAVVLSAAALASVSAQAGAGRGKGQAIGPHQGPGGPGQPMMMLRGLDLTEAQREQIRAIAEENRPDEAQRQKVGDLHKSLHAAVFADSPDLAQIEQLKAALGEAEAAALTKRVDAQLKIAQVLTAEQRAKAREMPARGPGRGRGGR